MIEQKIIHICFSVLWLLYSLVTIISDLRSGRPISMWAAVGNINSTIWIATLP